ncbi:MAG: Ig domain-containing protein [Myxococcota bacterium]
MILATLGVGGPPAAYAQSFTLLHAFGIGDDPGDLGFVQGDVADYDQWPFFDVGPQGNVVVGDAVHNRALLLAVGASMPIEALPPAPAGFTLEGAKAIADGEVLVVWQGEQRVLRRYSPQGAVLAHRDGVIGDPVGELADGSLLFVQTSQNRTVYERTDRSLVRLSIGEEMPRELGVRDTSVTTGVKLQTVSGCYIFPLALRGAVWTIQGAQLLALSGSKVGKVPLTTRTLTLWQLPRSEYTGGPAPGVEGPDADGRRDVVVEYGGALIGADGNFYSLVHRSTSFEIVRWNLAELPSQTYPAPATDAPPQIDPIPAQTATVGQELKVIFQAHDDMGVSVTVNVENLPQGAVFQSAYGRGRSLIKWKARADQVGSHDVTVVATDRTCGRTTLTFRITVQ